jgi:ribosomal protein S18 acetylase RimI-like enzyme
MVAPSLRRYLPADQTAVRRLFQEGLDQTGTSLVGTVLERPNMEADLDDIPAAYLNNGGEFLVVTDGDAVVGMGALAKVDAVTAEVRRMRTTVTHQRRGLGLMVLDRLLERARELGYRKVVLDTTTQQPAAMALYEKCGFREVRRKEVAGFVTVFYELML